MMVLLVEDNPLSARVIETNLCRNGYQVLMARSAEQAFEMLGSTPCVDLVISDILMPGMSGLDLLGSMRAAPESAHIPVILVTALSDMDTMTRAITMGCRHYVVKPVQADHLLRKVREALNTRPPGLRDPEQTMVLLGVDREGYKEVCRAYADQLTLAVAYLEGQIGGEGGRNGIPFRSLAEGAELLGAQRLGALLDQMAARDSAGRTPPNDRDARLLLREMQTLLQALCR